VDIPPPPGTPPEKPGQPKIPRREKPPGAPDQYPRETPQKYPPERPVEIPPENV